jgi:hypothetical protein
MAEADVDALVARLVAEMMEAGNAADRRVACAADAAIKLPSCTAIAGSPVPCAMAKAPRPKRGVH